MERKVTVNKEQGLYVIPEGPGYSCLGFEVADRKARTVAAWVGIDPPTAKPGTLRHYYQYHDTLMAGFAHHDNTGERCEVELTPQLIGLEGRRVQVTDKYGQTRRFQVGKSTGWMPCHLEIARRDSSGGSAVTGAPFKEVRIVR